jgi:hypothetical protein
MNNPDSDGDGLTRWMGSNNGLTLLMEGMLMQTPMVMV